MFKQKLIYLALIVFVAILFRTTLHWVGQDRLLDQHLVIKAFSSAGEDWIDLYNATDEEIDVSGIVMTDGDNEFKFPTGAAIAGEGTIRLAACKDDGQIDGVHHWWGWMAGECDKWGLAKAGELILFYDSSSFSVVDLVFSRPMQKGETARRDIQTGDWYIFRDGRKTRAFEFKSQPAKAPIASLSVKAPIASLKEDFAELGLPGLEWVDGSRWARIPFPSRRTIPDRSSPSRVRFAARSARP